MAETIVPKDFYVYAHRKATTGEIFYVGKGCGKRAWSLRRSNHWKNIVRKHGVVVEVVQDGLQEWAAFEMEVELIAFYGRKDCGFGSLVNLSDGGVGGATVLVNDGFRNLIGRASKATWAKKNAADRASWVKAIVESRRDPSVALKTSESLKKSWAADHKRRFRHAQQMISRFKDPVLYAQHRHTSMEINSAKSIKNQQTGMVFDYGNSAGVWISAIFGSDKKSAAANIRRVCKTGKVAYGYTWQYA